MQRWLVLFCLIWQITCNAQDTLRVFSWESALNANRDSVFAIDASQLKWEVIPAELYEFKQLRFLNLSKNKLSELPLALGELKQLKVLDATKNKITSSPIVICQLPNLRKLHLARNKISSLPACIGFLSELTVLDIWDNPIGELPDELLKLQKLKAVDMRSIMLSPGFQSKWQDRMPQVTWYFDAPCHCVD